MSTDLPIISSIPDIKEKLSQHMLVILQAPPGAGKSTLLPIELLNETWLNGKKIIMLEPRRLAARSVANRMASNLNEPIGETVGFRIRFENCISSNTRIEVVTEGILTRMLQTDSLLEDVGLVIFDEFHERSLHADLALVLCKQVQQLLRDDLRILIMSATIDGNNLSALLNNAPVVSCKGRQYPVSIQYLPIDAKEPIHIVMARAINKALSANKGDILAFLPGAGEINRSKQILEEQDINAAIHPLYGDLSFQKQQEAIMPNKQGRRKVVLATSIAETSLTIEGITIVIDCGFSRMSRYDPGAGLSRLETLRVNKSAADQRAGRAGRLGPGICYRLWSEETNRYLHEHHRPEILDADLSSLFLELSMWGIKDMNELDWITQPPLAAVKQAKELLQQLDAIDKDGITERGKEILKLPTHPRLAHMLIEAKDLSPLTIAQDKPGEGTRSSKWIMLAADMAALLDSRDVLPKEAGADLNLRIRELRLWRNKERVNADRNMLENIERLAASWRKTLNAQIDNTLPDESNIGKLLAAAYPERIAKRINKDGTEYRMTNGRIAKLLTHDPLAHEEWLVIAQLDAGSNEGKIFLASSIDPSDVMHLAKEREVIEWNTERGLIVAVKETYIGNITISSRSLENIPDENRVQLICNAIRAEGLNILNWTEQNTQWQNRILSVRAWRPEEDWPDVSTEKLLSTLEEWLVPYLTGINKRTELQKLNMETILSGFLSWELNTRLQNLAPDTLKVPSGSFIKLKYFADGSTPEMAVRLQEVFGLHETPTINEGRTKILLHLLSPAYRPVQVTQDLKSFWDNAYKEVRKELRVRYLKHYWPEDPWTAEAVKGVKRKK